MKWETQFYIPAQDEDMNRVLGAGAIMRLMHECAELQVREMGPSNESLRERGQAFLISRFALDMPHPLSGFSTVRAVTWGCPCRGYSFNRCYEIWQGEQLVARGKAVMALIDIRTRHLIRCENYHPGFTVEPEIEVKSAERFLLPPTAEMTMAGKHTVAYADCDLNGHLNNTRYAEMFCGVTDMRGKRVTALSVNYQREAPLGTELSVYKTEENGHLLLRSLLPDGTVNAEALMTLAPL